MDTTFHQAGVSTRGNAEPLLAAMVVGALHAVQQRRPITAGALVALGAHSKIFPAMYALPILLFMDANYAATSATSSSRIAANGAAATGMPAGIGGKGMPPRFFTKARLHFAGAAAAVFIALTALMYRWYGYEFLHQVGWGRRAGGGWVGKKNPNPWQACFIKKRHGTAYTNMQCGLVSCSLVVLVVFCFLPFVSVDQAYFYHLTRRDHRHNFSPYFLMLYLTFDTEQSMLLGLLPLVLQVVLLVVVAFFTFRNLEMACFLQTVVFVIFNKVCTAQYFLWYLCLLPLIVPDSTLSARGWGKLGALWLAAQGAWLAPAYFLEFEGVASYVYIWLAGLGFFAANVYITTVIVAHNKPSGSTGGDRAVHGGRSSKAD